MLIDTHTHLHFRNFNRDREAVIERSKATIEAVFEAGVDANTNEKVLSLAAKHPKFIYPVLGLHPTENVSLDECAKVEAQIKESSPVIIAVGEIGLDYHHKTPKDMQLVVFNRLLSLAESLRLPVVVHSRDAEQDCLDALASFRLKRVVMHCFSSKPLVKECITRGYFVSIPTTVCFSKGTEEIALATPLSSMLLETDCPFLSPLRGKRNEPAFLPYSVSALSKLLNKKPDEISSATASNARIFI